VFNVGAFRRKVGGRETAEFFDSQNTAAAEKREGMARTVLMELLDWLNSGDGDVGIFDATNTTDERRRDILELATAKKTEEADIPCPDISVLFIESVCDDPIIVERNIRQKIVTSPDYACTPPDKVSYSRMFVRRHVFLNGQAILRLWKISRKESQSMQGTVCSRRD
jgi:hypothetical protein